MSEARAGGPVSPGGPPAPVTPVAPVAPVISPIPAATVVLTRPAPGGVGLEVLLTRRPASMAFAPDMHVFPGGRVDPGDAHPRLVARCTTSADAAASAMGADIPAVAAIATHIAAIREAFEEVGVLLAERVAGGGPPDGDALATARAAMLDGTVTFLDVVERLDLRLRTDRLMALSRWVTPPVLPRRFDARFFIAAAPDGVVATLLGDEVAEHGWHTPRGALDAMAAGGFGMWAPTSSTLQQLEHVRSIEDAGVRLAPGVSGPIEVEAVAADVVRIVMPAGGGVAGQPVYAYLVGRSRYVLVDPGDPTGPALERAVGVARERGGSIVAVALTHADADHAAGAEGLAEQLGVPVFGGPGAGRDLPFSPTEVGDGAVIDLGDVPLSVVETPGPRSDHVAFVVGERSGAVRTGERLAAIVLAGDLEGVRGARSVPAPRDEAAWARSVARLRSVAPGAPWFGGHPAHAGERPGGGA